MKTCTRCNKTLPELAFRNGDRTDCQCRNCRQEAKRQFKLRNPHDEHARKLLSKANNADPNAYAYLIGRHVAGYVNNAIQRFERNTHLEAHPSLTAIRDLANNLAAEAATNVQLPPDQKPCELCGKPFKPKTTRSRYCKLACGRRAREQRRLQDDPDFNRRKYDRRLAKQGKTRQPPRTPKPPPAPPTPRTCPECGASFTPKGRKTFCSGPCWYAHYYRTHRDDYIRRANESHQRRTSTA